MEPALDDLAEQFVGVETSQFFGQAVAQVAARQRDVVHGLVRLHESDDVDVGALELDHAGGAVHLDALDAAGSRRRGKQLVTNGNLQLQLQPGREQRGGGGVGCAVYLGLRNRLVWWLVEHSGELRAPQREPGPGEVRVAGLVGRGEVSEKLARIALRRSIRDSALGDAPERRLRGHRRRLTGPPGHDGSIRQQQPGDEPLLVGGGVSIGLQHDDLARAGIAAHADLGIQARRVTIALPFGLRRDDDDAHRVLARSVVRGLDRLLFVTERGRDDEGEHAAEGDFAALLANLDERLRDVAARGVRQVDDHGRLQFRPSRVRSSSADAGPQVPGRYCSGCPRVAQYSSIGSRIFQLSSTSWCRGNSGGSPSSTSRMSRSYASGLASVKACPYPKSIVTSRTCMLVPGTFDPKRMVTPSSGCTRITSAFWPSAEVWLSANRYCGARLNTTAISV